MPSSPEVPVSGPKHPTSLRLRSGAKRVVRPLAAPVLLRLYTRVDARVDEQIGGFNTGGSVVTDEHLRLLLDAVSTTNAELHQLRREVALLSERQDQLESTVARLGPRPSGE